MKRILITSTDLMMVQFLLPHVRNLSECGYEVELACSDVGDRLHGVKEKVGKYVSKIHEVRLRRNPLSPINIKGYRDMKRIMSSAHYDIVWTNEPVMGVVTRLCASKLRRIGTKVMYMAHGFHFFDGAPLINWLIYYPIEKIMSRYSDVIVTVNSEDYKRAQTFHSGDVRYIHGIGINTDRLTIGDRQGNVRKELGISDDAFIILSVGELNMNKNQSTVIKALSHIHDKNIHYLICGKGIMKSNLEALVAKLGLDKNVHFLGYRMDVVDICSQSDVYVMPSFREGLPVSSLEAMYCGLPLLTSNIRGLNDVNKDGVNGYLYHPRDVKGFSDGIMRLKQNPKTRKNMGLRNKQEVLPYIIENTKQEVMNIIDEVVKAKIGGETTLCGTI